MSIAKHDCVHGQFPLKVIVVGGGIGGMAAAIALRQQGHEVKVEHILRILKKGQVSQL